MGLNPSGRFRIRGTGCCLLDLIHARVDFHSPEFQRCRSRRPGDGGLEPGKLVFTEDFEAFTGKACLEALDEITGGHPADARNIGGPAAVALILAAQVLDADRFEVSFTGTLGHDAIAEELGRLMAMTPLGTSGFLTKPGLTPFTYVLSDPSYAGGRGERTFVNNIGTAGMLGPPDLPSDFFDAELVLFGGTGLVPVIHDALDRLVPQARASGAFTVVNTVYDFRHQRRNPWARWPLGATDATFAAIDLLIADHEEALRLSGKPLVDQAVDWFLEMGVGAAVVTNGAGDIVVGSGSDRFSPTGRTRLPASSLVIQELETHPERRGDTTGAGDNFAGGVVASVALQLESGRRVVDLVDAVAWGASAGGLACFQMGGVWWEVGSGEKLARLKPYVDAYLRGRG